MGARAQDPHFTQFFANPMYVAPSYAGASQGHRFVLSYRDQWSIIPRMYRTLSFSYDINVASLRSGFGFFLLGDVAGDGNLGTLYGGALYSFSVSLTPEWSFRPGIAFFVLQRSVNYSRLVWGDQLIDGASKLNSTTIAQAGKNSVYDIDAAVSVLFHSANAWVGSTWDHMLRPKDSFFGEDSQIPWKFSIYGGYRFVLSSQYRKGIDQSLSLNGTARLQGVFSQMELGTYWFKYPLLLGVWYRGIPLVKEYMGSDALAFLVGLRFSLVQVAYSYDLTVSNLGPSSGGSHEITITYESPRKPKRRRYRAPTCPPY